MGLDVDKAGRDREPRGVDHLGRRLAAGIAPSAAIRPSRTATSPISPGRPLPSITSPPRIRMSPVIDLRAACALRSKLSSAASSGSSRGSPASSRRATMWSAGRLTDSTPTRRSLAKAEHRKAAALRVAAHDRAIVAGGDAGDLQFEFGLVAPEPRHLVVGCAACRRCGRRPSAPGRRRSAPIRAAPGPRQSGSGNWRNRRSPRSPRRRSPDIRRPRCRCRPRARRRGRARHWAARRCRPARDRPATPGRRRARPRRPGRRRRRCARPRRRARSSTPSRMRPGEKARGRRRYHPPHRVLRHLDDVHADPGGARHRGEFEADKTGADHHHVAHFAEPLGAGCRHPPGCAAARRRRARRPAPASGRNRAPVASTIWSQAISPPEPRRSRRPGRSIWVTRLAGDELDPLLFRRTIAGAATIRRGRCRRRDRISTRAGADRAAPARRRSTRPGRRTPPGATTTRSGNRPGRRRRWRRPGHRIRPASRADRRRGRPSRG